VGHNQYEPPTTVQDTKSRATSAPRGCGFGCLYMFAAFIGFGLLFGLIAPLIFRENLEAIGQLGLATGLFLVAPIAGLIGFLQHQRRNAS